MKTKIAIMTLLIAAFAAIPVYSQIDFAQKAELTGIIADAFNEPDSIIKSTSISFVFNGKPKKYFYNINKAERKLTIEFYESKKADGASLYLTGAPVVSTVINNEKFNVNEGIEGLLPDRRDLIRCVLELDKDVYFEENVHDDFNVVTVKLKWSLQPFKTTQIKPERSRWKIIGGVIAGVSLATAGIYAYIVEPPPTPPDDNWTKEPIMPQN
ncbi:MAG: hypothetical protein JNL74_22175 [Fibrobacteres bacterium]|nr:hypothetical protein [Fibrobacterota bacterium]